MFKFNKNEKGSLLQTNFNNPATRQPPLVEKRQDKNLESQDQKGFKMGFPNQY